MLKKSYAASVNANNSCVRFFSLAMVNVKGWTVFELFSRNKIIEAEKKFLVQF